MGLASHFGPWRLGTVPNTTGTTAGTINNMGATIVAQTAEITFNSTAQQVFVLPAGALITNIQIITTTAFTITAVATVYTTDFYISSDIDIVALGAHNGAIDADANAANYASNVGPVDSVLYVDITGTTITEGAGTLVIQYMVRLPNGTYNPTAQTA